MIEGNFIHKTINALDYRTFKLANPDLNALSDAEIEVKLGNSLLLEIANGQRKFHADCQPYNEVNYLNTFPVINEQVKKGTLRSGFEHFCESGYKEILIGEREWKTLSRSKENEIKNEVLLKGHIDGYASNVIWGWAIDENNMDRKLTLELYIDDVKICETTSDNYREDLKQCFQKDGRHAFKIDVDSKMKLKNMGLITMKDKASKKILPTNVCSLKYDLEYLYSHSIVNILKKNSIKDVQASIDLYELAIQYFEQKNFSEALPRLEEVFQKKETFPQVLYVHLLTIYLASNDISKAMELYQDAFAHDISEEVEGKIHSLVLSYCSDLWREEAEGYISNILMHKIEFLLSIMANVKVEKNYLFTQYHTLDNLLLYFIKSDFLVDENSIQKLSQLITKGQYQDTESTKGVALYIENLPEIVKLVKVTHQVELCSLHELTDWVEKLLAIKSDHVVIKSVVEKYLFYLDVLMNSKQIEEMNADVLLRFLQRTVTPFFGNSLHVSVLVTDLLYLLDRKERAAEMLKKQFPANSVYFDRHCKYLSEIFFYTFETSLKIEDPAVITLMQQRVKEERTNYSDNVMLLSYIYEKKNAADIDLLYRVMRNLIRFKPTVPNVKLQRYVEELMTDLMHGTMNIYVENSKQISHYYAGGDKKGLKYHFHNSRLFDFQNLQFISILNEQKESVEIPLSVETRYTTLLENTKCKNVIPENEPVEKKEKVAVFALVDALNEDYYLDYYKSMLSYAKNSQYDIFLCAVNSAYHLSWQENEKLIVERLDSFPRLMDVVTKSRYKRYMILQRDTIVHHHSVNTFVGESDDVLYTSSLDEGYSFGISHMLFAFFLQTVTIAKSQNIQKFFLEMHKSLLKHMQSNNEVFTYTQQGLVSFEKIPDKEKKYLMNHASPVFELQDTKKSLSYLTSLYKESRVTAFESINVGDIALTLVKPLSKETSDHDVACILVQRNEYVRLEGFLEYYRALGVKKFYIVDNASDDNKTLDLLLDQDDVELYSTPQAYSQSKYGVKWAEAIIQSKRVGKWTLLLDADELLVLDDKFKTLPALCSYLDENGHDCMHTAFVDMYSKDPISQTPYAKRKKILDHCMYHDRRFYTFFDPNGGIKGDMNTYIGGVRSRVFGLETVILNKVPLFKYDTGHKIREGIHWIEQSNPAYAKAVLLHFKYIETFHSYVEEESRRGQHWDGASEYQQYHTFLENNPDFSLYHPQLSSKFVSVEDFYAQQFEPWSLNIAESK